ncbi:hypothetical protein CVT25_000294 [Psilocybe cyanescens]|uniref:Granulins domain-containing protein n=1 Tax=Psilocybe cyanescens TaxID=93625 RepID=A0A409XU50_PSICY|nr:hypothetical protein CVT25_000294 [Psilocybe cyanescens]
MPTPFAAFILLLSYIAVFSTATQLLPAFKSAAEKRPTTIRGLLDIAKRQGFCPAPQFGCEFNFCCPNTNWRCCSDGSCCQPDTNCVLASNGIIGCCPDGEICSGPVGPPVSTTFTIRRCFTLSKWFRCSSTLFVFADTTTTRTTTRPVTTRSLTTIEPLPSTARPVTTRSLTTIEPLTSTAPPVTTRSSTTISFSTLNEISTTTTPTFIFTSSTANNTLTQSSNQPVLTSGLPSSVSGATQDVGVFVAILTYSFVVIAMVIL